MSKTLFYIQEVENILSVSDLIDIKNIPAERDISLQLLIDFYKQYLCKRIFIFTLRGGKVIKLFFRDTTEIFHISGINHIYHEIPMDGSRFIEEVEKGSIDFNTLKSINANAYKDFEIRICSMACLDTIIKNCEYLWYPSGKISGSNVKVQYLLLKGLDGKNLHLGIDTYNEKRPYFSKTLLVTEGNTASKFIDKADDRLRISKLEIRDKDTDEIFIKIEREKAEQVALEETRKCAKNWFKKEFQKILFDYLTKNNIENITRQERKIWKSCLKKNIETEKLHIKQKVEALDPYWAGKIVAEVIKKYEKEEADSDIEKVIERIKI